MMEVMQDRVVPMSKRMLALGMLVALLVAMLLASSPAQAASPFTVNSTGDDGDLTPGNGECYTGVDVAVEVKGCTLRAAIQEANAFPGADAINFGIPTTGVATISPATGLPKIAKRVSINGYSQPGAKPNTLATGSDVVLKIELSGANAPDADGLEIGAANSTVKGLVINNWSYAGIRIDGPNATGNRITGNFIGSDVSGTQDLGNGQGVRVFEGSNNTIGGATPAERNVLSGNAHSGIGLGDGDGPVTDNRITGNYIGTDKTGTKALGNALYGVNIEGAPGTAIGGTTAAARNVISGNDNFGIDISSGGTEVLGNFVGTDATGTKDLGNSEEGVYITGRNNTVGGATAAERNIISANNDAGIAIQGATASGNKVAGNYVGTDVSGTKDLGNTSSGVFLGASNNTVGGAMAGERNVISGNDTEGVLISGNNSTGNKVWGNYVGTDKSGTANLGNGNSGVVVSEAPNNAIGGTTPGARNIISGNNESGIFIGGADATGNEVAGNFIGTDASGAKALGNTLQGVFVYFAPNNTIGGTTAGARNIITGNGGDGVGVFGAGATGNRILSNSIYANGDLGIDLNNDGVTANDTDDSDNGPNNLQNYPVLSSARKGAAGATTVRGTLNSTPNGSFRVQFFSNPSGTDEGKTLLGSEIVSTNGSGDASFVFSTKKEVRVGQNITATATGSGGNTSEFSTPERVVAP